MRHTVKKTTFVQDFFDNFVPSVPIKILKKLNCYAPDFGYLWMVCEHNLVTNLKGDEAMIAYDKVDKNGAIEFQYDNGFLGDDVSVPLANENDTIFTVPQLSTNRSGGLDFKQTDSALVSPECKRAINNRIIFQRLHCRLYALNGKWGHRDSVQIIADMCGVYGNNPHQRLALGVHPE